MSRLEEGGAVSTSRILLLSFALSIRSQPVNGTEKGAAGSSPLMGKGWPQLAVMSGSQPAGQAPREGDGYKKWTLGSET